MFARLHLFPGKVQIRALQHLLEPNAAGLGGAGLSCTAWNIMAHKTAADYCATTPRMNPAAAPYIGFV